MNYKDGQFVSAYTKNDTLFEGYVCTKRDGTKVVLNEDRKWLPIDKLQYIKIIESNDEQEEQTNTLVQNDVETYKGLKDVNDSELEKIADKREKEVMSAGLDVEQGDYSNALQNAVKAAQLDDQVQSGNISQSDALSKYKQSKEQDIEMRIKKSLKESNLEFDENGDIDSSYFEDFALGGDNIDIEDPSYWEDAVDIDPYNIDYDVDAEEQIEDAAWVEPIHYDDDDKFNEIYESVSSDIERCIDLYEETCDRYSENEMYKFIAETLGYTQYKATLKECNDCVPDAVIKMAENISMERKASDQ